MKWQIPYGWCIATMEPREEGFELERIIHEAALKIPGVSHCLRENGIRYHFGDNSLNGVDHWIQCKHIHVLIQDKWKENITQQEVSQFLYCADRIKKNISTNDIIYLIWATKKQPTANSLKILQEKDAIIIQCDISIESLSRKVLLQINDCFGTDPSLSLNSIPNTLNETVELSKQDLNILLKNIVYTPEFTEEERELLKIRKELAEKKRLEEEQQKKDEEKVRGLLNENNGNNPLAMYLALHGGNCFVNNWKPEYYSVKNLLEGYEIIQKFRETIEPKVRELVQEFMKELWDKAHNIDEMERMRINNYAHQDCRARVNQKLSNNDESDLWHHNHARGMWTSPPPPPIYWKGAVVSSIYTPFIEHELREWNKYVMKYNELSNKPDNHPRPTEARAKIKSLEDEITSLKERNGILQKKLDAIRGAL